jgi:hypothetical protein
LNTPSSVTSANGEAATVYVTDTVAGVVQRILARDLNGTEGFSPDIIPISGPPASYEVTATSYAPTVASDIIISAQLADIHRNAVKRADRIVTWSANFEGESSGKFSAPTSTTNGDGVATVTYTMAPTVTGPLIVFAVDNFSDDGSSKPINAQPAPMAKYVITASVIDPPGGAGVLVFAQAADTYGNSAAVSGRTLTWSKTGSDGSFAAPTTLTDDNGSSSIVFTTGSVPGSTYTVSVTDGTGFAGTSPTINTTQQISLQSVAAGFGATSTCGIARRGQVQRSERCWRTGQRNHSIGRFRKSPNATMTSLSAGLAHTCGIAGGVVYCWGRNKDGQLGDNIYIARSSPAPIIPLSFTAVLLATTTRAIATGGDATADFVLRIVLRWRLRLANPVRSKSPVVFRLWRSAPK